MSHRWGLFAAVVGAGVALDQLTKYAAHAELRGRGIVTVIEGFFELRYVTNPGAFFSLGAELGPIFFVAASALASALIVRLYAKADAWPLKWALLFLLGGAIGNLIDRVVHGEVIDFVHLHWRDSFDWATFNVADVLITAGLGLLVVDLLRPRRVASATDTAPSAPSDESGEKRALHTETSP